jgi:hypothetical protein
VAVSEGWGEEEESSDATPSSTNFIEGVVELKHCHYLARLTSMLRSQHKVNKEPTKLAAVARDPPASASGSRWSASPPSPTRGRRGSCASSVTIRRYHHCGRKAKGESMTLMGGWERLGYCSHVTSLI